MKNIGKDRVLLGVAEARALGEKFLARLGYNAEEAWIICDHVMDAALCGYEYSGLPKLLNVAEHKRQAEGRRPLSVLRETPVSALYDGGNSNGMLAMYRMSEIAIAKARAHGFAVVGINNTWMSGRSAYFAERVARADLVCLHSVSSFRHVAPPGAAAPATGTNPIAFGFPTAKEPFVIDMSTSAFPGTQLLFYERRGEQLPEGVALDAQGVPTRDPSLAHAFLPFGGHKGFGLALAMQSLGILAGSGRDVMKIYGHLIIAMKPDLLVPLDEFKADMSRMLAEVKSVPRQPGVNEIRLPSERAFAERERRRSEGIEIDVAIYEALRG